MDKDAAAFAPPLSKNKSMISPRLKAIKRKPILLLPIGYNSKKRI